MTDFIEQERELLKSHFCNKLTACIDASVATEDEKKDAPSSTISKQSASVATNKCKYCAWKRGLCDEEGTR